MEFEEMKNNVEMKIGYVAAGDTFCRKHDASDTVYMKAYSPEFSRDICDAISLKSGSMLKLDFNEEVILVDVAVVKYTKRIVCD